MPNILGVFTRPQKVTEEEVSISKERKICVACKSIGLRFTYICPKCNTIYCKKCAHALSTQENACWVCHTPFDESKPSKPFEDQESEKEVDVIHTEDKKM